jgi:hypothetical protein
MTNEPFGEMRDRRRNQREIIDRGGLNEERRRGEEGGGEGV